MKKKLAEEEIEQIMKAYSFSYVNDINRACSPYIMAGDAKISYYQGFKICKAGRSYFIEVTDPAKRDRALHYARLLLRNNIRHYDDDYREIEECGRLAARDYERLTYGPEYVKDIADAKAKSYETGHYGIYIENSLRPFSVEFPDDDVSA